MLPTDDRFKTLTEKQKELLLISFLEQPTEEQLHMAYQQSQKREADFNVNPTNLRKTGYSEEQIRRIRAELDKVKKAL